MGTEQGSIDDRDKLTCLGDTWWMDGDCPECGHVVYNNGKIRTCGEADENCKWWEEA